MSDSEGLDADGSTHQPSAEPDRSGTDGNLAERLAAVERAITDEGAVADLSTTAERDRRLEDLTERIAAVEARLDELDAATQALRGYVGGVRAVNQEVEQRADLALAIAERTERNATPSTAEDDDPHGTATPSHPATTPKATEEQPGRATSGADDGDVAAAVGEASGDHGGEQAAADPAVAAAIPDGGGSDGPDDGVLARLRDVL